MTDEFREDALETFIQTIRQVSINDPRENQFSSSQISFQ